MNNVILHIYHSVRQNEVTMSIHLRLHALFAPSIMTCDPFFKFLFLFSRQIILRKSGLEISMEVIHAPLHEYQ